MTNKEVPSFSDMRKTLKMVNPTQFFLSGFVFVYTDPKRKKYAEHIAYYVFYVSSPTHSTNHYIHTQPYIYILECF